METKKYELTDETMQLHDGSVLHRIRRLSDGMLGGWIESEYNLSHEGCAWVSGKACVRSNARVYGHARVYGDAEIFGEAQVYDHAHVYDHAQVSGKARVYGYAHVRGSAYINDSACIFEHAVISKDAELYDNAQISGGAHISDRARIAEDARVYGGAHIAGEADVRGQAQVYDAASIYGTAVVRGNAHVYGDAKVCGDSIVFGEARIGDRMRVGYSEINVDYAQNVLEALRVSLNVGVVNGVVRLYKYVKRIDDTTFTSIYNPSFIYRVGETIGVEADPDPTVSCGRGLHASTLSYWEYGYGVDACIAVDIRVEDIICVLDGKVRCKRLTVVGVVENSIRFSKESIVDEYESETHE